MVVFCKSRSSLAIAVAVGAYPLLMASPSAMGQQSSTDPIVLQTASDSNSATATSFNTGGHWGASTPAGLAAATTPTPGYAYVDKSFQLRTPASTTTNNFAFGGDSLTLIPSSPVAALDNPNTGIGSSNNQTAYFDLKGATASSTITINNLVLANGGVVQNFANDNQVLAGNIYLVPDGVSLDGITTSVNGGMIDSHGNNLSGYTGTGGVNENYFTITSNISGGGMLRLTNTGGAPTVPQVIILSGSNAYSGGTVLDNTSTFAGTNTSGNSPDLAINSVNALGSGPLTILGISNATLLYPGNTGPTIDNLTGSAEALTTANAQTWNSNFVFAGSSALEMGGNAPITLGANVSLDVAASTLTEDGAIGSSSGFGLTKAGPGTLVLHGAVTTTGFVNVSGGTLVSGSSIAGPVTLLAGGALQPGTPLTPGTLSLFGPMTENSGSALDIRVSGTGYDEVVIAGQLTLGGLLSITLLNNYVPPVGTTYTIIADSSSLATIGTFSNDNGSGIVTDSSGNFYQVNYAANTDGGAVANDITLTYIAPVPEPSTAALACVAGLLIRRRIRRV